MNMKNIVVLLIFLLAVLGLIIGVCYTEEVNNDNSPDSDIDSLSEDSPTIFHVPDDERGNILTTYFHEKFLN